MHTVAGRSARLDTRIARRLILALLTLGLIQGLILGLSAMKSFSAVENSATTEDIVRVQAALESEKNALIDIAREYAARNDTRDFILGLIPDYPSYAFSKSWYEQTDMDLVAITNLDGRILWSWSDQGSEMATPGTCISELADLPASSPTSAYSSVDDHPIVFAAYPVSEKSFSAASVGWIVLSRSIDAIFLERLSIRTGLSTALSPESVLATHDMAGIRTFGVPLADLNDNVIGSILFSRPRPLDRSFKLLMMYLAITIVLSVLGSTILLVALLRSIIVKPLKRITGHLRECEMQGRASVALAMGKHAGRFDEIGQVSDCIDALVGALDQRRGDLQNANSELENLNRELERLARVDPLTGLANRRSFDEHAKREIRKLARDKRQTEPILECVILLCDIDHFKLYNDRYGHQAGDACLRAVADTLAGEIYRPSDLVCRYGGEEFIVLLPGTDGAGGAIVGQRILDSVRSIGLPHEDSPTAPFVTMSIGLAVMEFKTEEFDLHELVGRADAALYRAKHQGRNRMELG
ncbi:MAG: diguanylate cyclase [Spirochaetales bacterium]|nr:MAG: diguanylate cyclase [Spirochaetales bacterium]